MTQFHQRPNRDDLGRPALQPKRHPLQVQYAGIQEPSGIPMSAAAWAHIEIFQRLGSHLRSPEGKVCPEEVRPTKSVSLVKPLARLLGQSLVQEIHHFDLRPFYRWI
jgi:hypothetical protein